MIKASIIIPAFNDAEHLQKTLQAINEQDYPKEKTEVIVIDNGSTDNTRAIAKSFPFVQLLKEEQYLDSPYSARNRGIEAAQGEVIVLLDATCIPKGNWLQKGLECVDKKNVDLMAGNVRLDINDNSSLSEIYDAITNIQIANSVKSRGAAPTANLFIRREVFQKVGLFPEGVRSGADLRWTKKATDIGCVLDFCEEAISYKPARKFKGLVKKQWRVAKGQPAIWMEQRSGINLVYFIRILITTILLKPFKSEIKERLSKTDYVEKNKWLRIKLEGLNYLIKVLMKLGNLYGYISLQK